MRLSHRILFLMVIPIVGYILLRAVRETYTGIPGLGSLFSSNDFAGNPETKGETGMMGNWTFDARDRCHSCNKNFEKNNMLMPDTNFSFV